MAAHTQCTGARPPFLAVAAARPAASAGAPSSAWIPAACGDSIARALPCLPLAFSPARTDASWPDASTVECGLPLHDAIRCKQQEVHAYMDMKAKCARKSVVCVRHRERMLHANETHDESFLCSMFVLCITEGGDMHATAASAVVLHHRFVVLRVPLP